MEQHLLDLVPEAPDSEQMNAIFRAAHPLKEGWTFDSPSCRRPRTDGKPAG
ncbi:hypothetical protein [Yokenella regensburgei]|uniref:hypothetical protein n=1 Tax=Yokenella regensburgei TaxID=158877 RepID=UPI003CC917A2